MIKQLLIKDIDDCDRIDAEQLVTEDDTAVDNLASAKRNNGFK